MRGSRNTCGTIVPLPDAVAVPMPTPLADLRVLVVEDHPFQRTVASNLLRGLGVTQVTLACDGGEAMAMLAASPFDVVLCDIEMPVINGPQLMAELARRGSGAFAGASPVWVWMTLLADDILASHRDLAETLGLPYVHALHKPLVATLLESILTQTAARDDAAPAHAGMPDDEALLAAVRDDASFEIVLQPQFHLATGRLAGAEALCRWHHPALGNIRPDLFIPRLEALGAADPILFLAARLCLDVHQRLRTAGMEIELGINASAQTLCRPDVLERVEAMVEAAGVPRRLLTIELTEGFPVADTVALSVALNRLRLLGYGVAIDDFGVGIATLKLLADLPFTQIKLDRSFVVNVDAENQRTVICRSMIRLARDLGLTCVAEGIETESQRDALLALGCDVGQGYLWSRPLPIDAFVTNALSRAGDWRTADGPGA